MPRHKSDAIAERGKLARAHKDEHKDAAMAKGLAVGMWVRFREPPQEGFEPAGGVEHYGVVRFINDDHVVIETTAATFANGRVRQLLHGGKDLVLETYRVPFACVKEVLGKGHLAAPKKDADAPAPVLPPPREGGYTICDACGNEEQPPVIVYAVRKYDEGINQLGPANLVALCKHCDEPWPTATKEEQKGIPSDKPAGVPLVWRMGVVVNSWAVPKDAKETA